MFAHEENWILKVLNGPDRLLRARLENRHLAETLSQGLFCSPVRATTGQFLSRFMQSLRFELFSLWSGNR